MPLILGSQSAVSTGYSIDNCSRWNIEGRMERNFAAGDPDTWTFSCWFKGGPWGTGYPKILQGVDPAVAADNADTSLQFNTSDELTFLNWNSGYDGYRIPEQGWLDVGAWYHIVLVYDSGNGTPADRIKMYLNGAQITAFSTETNPDADQDSNFNKASPQCEFHLGSHFGRDTGGRFRGYMAEVAYVDGTVYAASDFGEFDEDSPTIWKPKDFSGDITFGTNGLYLDFADSANLGNDVSGNGNDLTESGFTAADQGTDTPTNNFCTMNPLDNFYVDATFSEGNNQMVIANGTKAYGTGTMGVSAGKWYWEVKMSANTGSDTDEQSLGIADRVATALTDSYAVGYPANYVYQSQGRFVESETTTADTCPDSYTTGDIMMVALDLVNDKLYFGKNGTWQCSGDPTSGATGTGAMSIKGTGDVDTSGFYFPLCGSDTTSRGATWQFNLGGCSAFDVTSANQDGNGYGNFEYAVPSGYLALCTKNLGSDGG